METFFFDLKLDQAAACVGVLGVILGLALLGAPKACGAWLPGLGRNKPLAWVLTALGLLWAAWLVYNTPMERFNSLKPALYIVTPVAFFLIIIYLEDLLAARAIGGLLLLLANPVLMAARWHESEWRLVMTIIAYIWAVAGILLVLSPYLWRRWVTPWVASELRCRATGALKLAFGIALLWLAWRVY